MFSRAPKFVKGDLVIIFSAKMFKKPCKLTVRWSGPFWVFASCGPTSFFLANLRGEVLPSLVNGFRIRTYFSKEGLQCPFLISEASEAIPALMVSLMPISWDLGSADHVLMSGSHTYLYHDLESMQKNI